MTNLITIVLPTYNGVKYLAEQLESIFNQTYKDFTLIVIDDNSTDSTIDCVIENCEKHHFTNYSIRKNDQNIGPTKSFELGVSISNTKYIAFSDQDDIWFENKLEYYINEIVSGDYDLVYSPSFIINGETKTADVFSIKKEYVTVLGELSHNQARGATILIRTDLAKSLVPYYDLYDKWIFVISKFVANIKYIDTPLHYYRIHSNNVNGGSFRWRNLESLLLVQQNNIVFYERMHSFFKNSNLKNINQRDEILNKISDLIKIFDLTIASLKSRNKLKSLILFVKRVAFIEFSLVEKAIYFYYMVLKVK